MKRFLKLFLVAAALSACDQQAFRESVPTSDATINIEVTAPCQGQRFYLDADEDGYGGSISIIACAAPAKHVARSGDCEDGDASIHPNAPEGCNGVDDNCNGEVDETLDRVWCVDSDGDGHGNPALKKIGACTGSEVWLVTACDDCDDTKPELSPSAIEICNDRDDNCNGQTDEGTQTSFFVDSDGDGFGSTVQVLRCEQGPGVATNDDDCDDALASVRPNAPEACNYVDDNCNGQIDEDARKPFFKDSDGDGYGNPAVPIAACEAPSGYVAKSGDCNDAKSGVNPGAAETCNEIDDNCNNVTDEGVQLVFHMDYDGDGFGNPTSKVTFACEAPKGMAPAYGSFADCDDLNAQVYPGAPELCDGKDNGCTGLPIKEPDQLCTDDNPYTDDFCKGSAGCAFVPRQLVFTCTQPVAFPASAYYKCNIAYHYNDVDKVGGTFEQVMGQDSVTLPLQEVCETLADEDKVLRVNSYVFLDCPSWADDCLPDLAVTWVGGEFVKVVASLTGLQVFGSPGLLTLSQGLDTEYVYKNLSCF